jgi:ribosomal protein S18 acetylase RimI-like enzyme
VLVNTTALVRRVTAADAARVRALRLEMLADAPLAFIERLDEAAARPHEMFRKRLVERVAGEEAAQFVAGVDGRLVGQAGGYAIGLAPRTSLLFAVYVTPRWRGTRLVDSLVDAVEAWSTGVGRPVLELEVLTSNIRAIRAYRRMGFVDTGHRAPHPTMPALTQLVMVRPG